MASVFTYEPDPPRVSSPWLVPSGLNSQPAIRRNRLGDVEDPKSVLLADCGITKLEAEPQEGPVEYKLHLLLRPRRSFSASSTGQRVSGSNQSRSRTPQSESSMPFRQDRASPLSIPSLQSRQNRLQHLTTQLLWRLQQSSPYHSSSTASLVMPILPEAFSKLGTSNKSEQLLPGLEESRGALYEIGVSDDGTLVGLTKDEMEESLATLRSMAASLGCRVQVLRSVIVGDCEWVEERRASQKTANLVHAEKLWVAEAFVVPKTHQAQPEAVSLTNTQADDRFTRKPFERQNRNNGEAKSQTEQLRVTLTGSTTSGKSSLLGTLSSSTMDNGRGKSRLSLLKHRHEIASGITSSVAPELIGYCSPTAKNGEVEETTRIANYGSGNISSWIDIHNATEGGRLVVLTDSAGHPRYRRTTVRGLVSWAPHWTLCCVAADADEDTAGRVGATASAQDILGVAGASVDLSKAHLDFCLKLGLPLMVVITKFDLASKIGLRQTLTKILSTIKAAGRVPVILPFSSNDVQEVSLESIPASSNLDIQKVLATYSVNEYPKLVPIVLTSAVTGTGIGTLHALLHRLTIPQPPQPEKQPMDPDKVVTTPGTLFHIDKIFTKPEQTMAFAADYHDLTIKSSYVLSGHLRYGELSVGDEIMIGPFASASVGADAGQPDVHHARSYPGHFRDGARNKAALQVGRRPSSSGSINFRVIINEGARSTGIWQTVRIISIRNLRLPVHKLVADQVGTIGVTFASFDARVSDPSYPFGQKIRKGMVLTQTREVSVNSPLLAFSGFLARFDDDGNFTLTIGISVVVYIASIRTSAKVVRIDTTSNGTHEPNKRRRCTEDVFGLDDYSSDEGGVELPPDGKIRGVLEVTFHFLTCHEWVETGAKVLIMPERTEKSSVGLEGFVGRITHALA